MKSFCKRLILVACFLLLPVIAFARDTTLPKLLDLGDDYSISLPADWTVTTNSQGVATVTSDDISLTILSPVYMNTLGLNLNAKSDLVEVMVDVFALPPDPATIKASDVQKMTYGDRQAAVYTYVIDSSTDGMVVILPMSSGSPGYLSFSAYKGHMTVRRAIISAIISSFTYTGTGTASPAIRNASGTGITGTEEAATEEAATGGAETGGTSEVDCRVSAERADSAQLRVGPGTNRGAISFLPVGVEVTVTGRIVLKDSSVWYQLDKAQAAPKGTAAAELWVAAKDVSATGDCDHVGDKSAPPVIPGNVAPPTNNGGNGSQGGASTTPGLLPAAGGWVLVMDATSNASCAGGNNFPYNTSETFDPTTYGDTIVGIDSNSFYYSSDTFTRIPGTNSFTGTFTYADGTPGYVRFNLVSPTTMTGQITVNYSLEGSACSETVQFVSTHG